MRITLLVLALIFIPPLAGIGAFLLTHLIAAFYLATGLAIWLTYFFGKRMLTTTDNAGYLGNEERFLDTIFLLAGIVMKSDGEIKQAELNWIENKLKEDFREHYADRYIQDFKESLKKEISLKLACSIVNRKFDYSGKISLMLFLVRLSAVDNQFSDKEFDLIRRINYWLRLNDKILDTILVACGQEHKRAKKKAKSRVKSSSSYTSIQVSYQILGIKESATDKQVKKAFRKLAVVHHPDKVIHLGEKFQKAAKDKFQKILDAYELIKTKRGFN